MHTTLSCEESCPGEHLLSPEMLSFIASWLENYLPEILADLHGETAGEAHTPEGGSHLSLVAPHTLLPYLSPLADLLPGLAVSPSFSESALFYSFTLTYRGEDLASTNHLLRLPPAPLDIEEFTLYYNWGFSPEEILTIFSEGIQELVHGFAATTPSHTSPVSPLGRQISRDVAALAARPHLSLCPEAYLLLGQDLPSLNVDSFGLVPEADLLGEYTVSDPEGAHVDGFLIPGDLSPEEAEIYCTLRRDRVERLHAAALARLV